MIRLKQPLAERIFATTCTVKMWFGSLAEIGSQSGLGVSVKSGEFPKWIAQSVEDITHRIAQSACQTVTGSRGLSKLQ